MAEEVLQEWAVEVSSAVGRSVADIRSKGLGASDFPTDRDLRITLMDGSFVQFHYALAVPSKNKRAIAVFTEHCGYHVFPDHEAVVTHVERR
jgi:hypothetical protein